MGSIRSNSVIGQVDQSFDEDVKIKAHKGVHTTREAAEAQAKNVAKSKTEDAVVTRENGKYHVYSTNEVGKLDPSANKTGNYPIHDIDPKVVSFTVTPRGYSGEDLGRAPLTKGVRQGQSNVSFQATRQENGIVHVGEGTKDFSENIANLNSGGDSVRIYAEGEGGARWGVGGVEFEGALDLTVSKDDDGWYTVSRTGRLGVFGTASAGSTLKGEAGVAGQYSVAYRSKDPKKVDDYLVHIARNMPGSDTFLPNLRSGPNMSNAKTVRTKIGEFQAEIEGKTKIGNVSLEGKGEFTLQGKIVDYPNGNHSNDDWSRTWSGSVDLKNGTGFGVKFSGSHETYVVNNNPITENNGRYKKIDGNVELTFSAADAAKFTGGDTVKLSAALVASGEALGLTGDLLNDYVSSGKSQVLKSVAEAGRRTSLTGLASTGNITVGIKAQAQWEVQTQDGKATGKPDKSKPDRLQYFRMGSTASVSYKAGFDAKVLYGKMEAGVQQTNLADVVVGRDDITYVQGLFFEQPSDYQRLKGKIGNRLIQGATLAQWEQRWKSPGFDRSTS